MASTGLDFAKLTPDNGAVRDLRELIFLSVMDVDQLGALFNFLPNQEHGKKVGMIGEFGMLGKASTGCLPSFNQSVLAASEKTWDIAEWQISEQICYTDLRGTLAKVAMRTKTQVADLTGTQYIDEILEPRLSLAIRKMLMRFAWFGDKAADTVTNGGVLLDTVDKGYFTLIYGFWKRLFPLTKETPARKTTIDANSETSFDAQVSALYTAGVPTGIIDSLIREAPMVLRQTPGQVIYITQSLRDALDWDIINNNKGSELQWTAIFDGIAKTTYKGVELLAIPFWDEIIRSTETVTGGKAWNKPHRALYTVKENLLVGSESENEIAELDIWFEKKDQVNYILAKDTIGTLIGQDDLLQVAF